jgi:hypothetical protein
MAATGGFLTLEGTAFGAAVGTLVHVRLKNASDVIACASGGVSWGSVTLTMRGRPLHNGACDRF